MILKNLKLYIHCICLPVVLAFSSGCVVYSSKGLLPDTNSISTEIEQNRFKKELNNNYKLLLKNGTNMTVSSIATIKNDTINFMLRSKSKKNFEVPIPVSEINAIHYKNMSVTTGVSIGIGIVTALTALAIGGFIALAVAY